MYNEIEYECIGGGADLKRKISASILNADLLRLGEELHRAEQAGVEMLHFDVMDGRFVPNISFGMPVLQAVSRQSELFMDVHLMIEQPHLYVQDFVKAGADLITFHLESSSDPFAVIRAIHAEGCKAGISLKPQTPARAVLPFLEEVETILVMTVEPGFGGQSYLHAMNAKIREIRELIGNRNCILEVDGGINPETIQEAADAGADLFVAGSYLFRAEDMTAAVQSLQPEGGSR